MKRSAAEAFTSNTCARRTRRRTDQPQQLNIILPPQLANSNNNAAAIDQNATETDSDYDPNATVTDSSAQVNSSPSENTIPSDTDDCSDPDDEVKDERYDTPRRRLHRIRRRLHLERPGYREKVSTITIPMNNAIRPMYAFQELALLSELDVQSEALGIARALHTLFLNYVLDRPGMDFFFRKVFERNFHTQLMKKLCGQPSTYNFQGAFATAVQWFTDKYTGNAPLMSKLRRLLPHIISTEAASIVKNIRQHVKVNYTDRISTMFKAFYTLKLKGQPNMTNTRISRIAKHAFKLFEEIEDTFEAIAQLCNDRPGCNDQHDIAGLLFHEEVYGCLLPGMLLSEKLVKLRNIRLLTSNLRDEAYDPPLFTLLPVHLIKRAFIPLDPESIVTLKHLITQRTGIVFPSPHYPFRTMRALFNLFDLYGLFRDHWQPAPRPAPDPLFDIHQYKIKRRRRDKRQGCHQLRSHLWATRLTLLNIIPEDPSGKLPVIVTSISTDGLQVKVHTLTLERIARPKTVRAIGVDGLKEREYDSIVENLDLGADKFGIFNSVTPNPDLIGTARITGINPGQKEIVTATIETTSENSFKLSKHARTTRLSVSADNYKDRTYAELSIAKELEVWGANNWDNPYNNALRQLDAVSLRYPGQSEAYVDVFFTHMSTIISERMKVEWRFNRFSRFSARQRMRLVVYSCAYNLYAS